MDLIKNIFGKVIKDLQNSDIEEFFSTEQQETPLLEFKSGKTEIDSICKEVCAFLNTNGGILIIGAPTKNKTLGKELYIGNLTPTNLYKSKQSLLQQITSRIVPSPLSILVKELEYKDGKIFILEIPQSFYPPHQNTSDCVYYIRLDEMSRPAPHGFIQALFNIRQNADLMIDFKIIPYKSTNKDKFTFRLSNISKIPAKNVRLFVEFYGIKDLIDCENILQPKSRVTKSKNLDNNYTFKHDCDILLHGIVEDYELDIEFFASNYIISAHLFSENSEIKIQNIVVNESKGILFQEFNTVDNISDLQQLSVKYNTNPILIKIK